MTFGESPISDEMPAELHGLVMHSCLVVGDAMIMGADDPSPETAAANDTTTINISVDSAEEAERIWKALLEGGEVKMPLEETFWAHRWGMLVDRYGKPWMVNYLKQSEDCPTPGKS
jgi:PhnB protein